MIGQLVGSGLSIIGGLVKSGRAKKEQRKLEKQLSEFRRQKLANVADGLAVSTLGADKALEQSAITTSTILEQLQKGSSRNLLSGIGGVQAQAGRVGSQVQADLDTRQKEIDRIRAADESKIRDTREAREIADLEGLGAGIEAARQDRAAGTKDIFAGITGMASAGESEGKSILSGLFGGGGGAAASAGAGATGAAGAAGSGMFSGAAAALSDRRLKEDINLIGTSPKGLNIYSFKYKNSKHGVGVYQGVMADEVSEDNTLTTIDGYKMVDYSNLDVEFKRIK